eukprot:928403-Pleurochrysis_carterae.AAC.4
MNARLLIVLMTKPERLIIELKRTGGESQVRVRAGLGRGMMPSEVKPEKLNAGPVRRIARRLKG